jgi:hypothetical protein
LTFLMASAKAKFGIVPGIRPWPFPSTSTPSISSLNFSGGSWLSYVVGLVTIFIRGNRNSINIAYISQ